MDNNECISKDVDKLVAENGEDDEDDDDDDEIMHFTTAAHQC